MKPIIGLLHHGSGPGHTHLMDKNFPKLFSDYAREIATRYPWVTDYTPINEPLTTARFSGLYGFWYPHQSSEASFLAALINQSKATLLAMNAIREINPVAKLIQTEDFGKISSSVSLNYQASFENERRWLSIDLLCGHVTHEHPLWNYLIQANVDPDDLNWICDHSIKPDIIGVNHYVTSNRYLDDNVENYPPHYRGGNGRDVYVDVETVRVEGEPYLGIKSILLEVADRYGGPIAVTESHLDAGREDQMRWLKETWQSCQELRQQGTDIRAITLWSLLGSFDWNSLCRIDQGYYESGVFDIRSGAPRPTALVKVAKNLVKVGDYQHPLLESKGWWHQKSHKLYSRAKIQNESILDPVNFEKTRPLVITGGRGTLGTAFSKFCKLRGIAYISLNRQDMDIAEKKNVMEVLGRINPWAVVNAAGYVNVDEAESNYDLCYRENVQGAVNVAEYCRENNIPFLTFSSDLVFDGKSEEPYVETSPVSPVNIYGKTKAVAEEKILTEYAGALIVRTSAFFGPWDSTNFVTRSLQQMAGGHTVKAPYDVTVSPTYIPDLVNCCLNLLIDDENGIWHLSNAGGLSWAEFAKKAAKAAGFDLKHIDEQPLKNLKWLAPRPKYCVLGTEKGQLLPSLEVALTKYFAERIVS